MRAGTGARSPTARWASARCASIAAARCTCRGATSAACSAIRSRRSRSSTRDPARSRTASACSAAICTARYCQNWVTSQALRDPEAVSPPLDVEPGRISSARRSRSSGRRWSSAPTTSRSSPANGRSRSSRKRARQGLLTALRVERQRHAASARYIRPWVDLYKVDLKSFDDRHYRQLGGRLEPILDTIRALHEMGIWVEIVTLLIPGFNDSRRRARAADRRSWPASRPTSRGT